MQEGGKGKIRCFVLLIWDELEGQDLDTALVEVQRWEKGCDGREDESAG
jgi:hypothetical protein